MGEIHETRPRPGSSSSTPTMLTVRSAPESSATVTVAPKYTRSWALPALSTTTAASRRFDRNRIRRSISRSFRLP